MDKNIKVSVLMAVYNGEKYINQAIDSVLNQTFKDFELIIVDDGSRDSTREKIEQYEDPRIVMLSNEKNLGLIDSLNKGLDHAQGKYTARLDHDDIALPERLKIQYDFMEENRDIDVVGSQTECIDSNGKSIKISRNPSNPITIQYEFLFNNVMLHSSIFFRTDIVKSFGGYSKDFIHSEDYEMYSRPGKELRCANIEKVLFKLRLHGDSITGSDSTQPLVYANAINVVFRNISRYIDISRTEFDEIMPILIIKKPNSTTSLRTLFKALRILKKVTKSFITKNNLSGEESRRILVSYLGKRKMLWQHYLIGKYQKIFKK